MSSLRSRLLLTLLPALLLTGLIASGATYLRARAEIDRLLDYQLRQQALALRDRSFGEGIEADPQQDIVVQVWDAHGGRLYLSHRAYTLPRHKELGLATVNTGGEDWRVYALAIGSYVIQVGQPVQVRRQMAAAAALRILVPILAAVPVFGLLIWWTVGRGLRPLNSLADTIARRDADSLEPVASASMPQEARPIVAALNGLLARLGEAMEVQREFTADAAHELRTPLTALKLQTQLLERARSDAERKEAIAALRDGVGRAAHLIERLMTLARLEPQADQSEQIEVALHALLQGVVSNFAAVAADKRIDLRLLQCQPVTLRANETAMTVLLRNLLDNAVRYTPRGGRIEVALRREAARAYLEIADNGPGIPPHERRRVFDRFYRVPGTSEPGSGLGLAIVRRAAELHRADLDLQDGLDGRGLRVQVSLLLPLPA
ncbi:MAG: ATP-binding protein [Chromatiales bacterium]